DAEALSTLLRDPQRTRFSWVLQPDALSVNEAIEGVATLRALEIPVSEWIVNRVLPADLATTREAKAKRAEQQREVARLLEADPEVPVRFVATREREPVGVSALRQLAPALSAKDRGRSLIRRGAP